MKLSIISGVVAATVIGVATAAAQAPVQSDVVRPPPGTATAPAQPPATQQSPKATVGNDAWCVELRGRSGGPQARCEYASLQQCEKFLEGRQGLCIPNPNARATTGGAGQ